MWGRVQWRGGRVDVDFSSLLCKSQGMVTINILYSLKPSKNTILEGGVGGGGHSLPHRSSSVYTSGLCYAWCCSYLHIYKYWAVQ